MAESVLAKKLQIKPRDKVLVINSPAGYADELRPPSDGARVSHRASGTYDVVHLFVRTGPNSSAGRSGR